MQQNYNIEEKLDNYCVNSHRALILFLNFFMPDRQELDKTAGYYRYRLSSPVISMAHNMIRRFGLQKEDMMGCFGKFSAELEKEARENIKSLEGHEFESLCYISHLIKDQLSNDITEFIIELSEPDKIRRVLAKSGLAFCYEWGSKLHCVAPPYAKRIIDGLTEPFDQQKLKPLTDTIHSSDDPKLLSEILITITGEEKEKKVFEEVYGKKLNAIDFPFNCFEKKILGETITGKVREYFARMKYIIDALLKSGFDFEHIYEPQTADDRYHYTFVMSKGIYVEMMPFLYKASFKSYERRVLVTVGPIKEPNAFKDYVVVELDNNFKIKKIYDNINGNWSKEITKILKSLNKHAMLISQYENDIEIMRKVSLYKVKTREILEAVTAAVFESIGFKVSVDEKKKSTSGIDVEVDVWAQKSNTPFKIYVSCKNYNGKIGSDIISNEIGRVMQLAEAPTMKIIIASEFAEQTRKIAEKNGFIPIDLGFQVNENNIIESYNTIYRELKKYSLIS